MRMQALSWIWTLVLFTTTACSKNIGGTDSGTTKPVFYPWSTFVMGSDLSYVNIVEAMGGTYKIEDVPKDVFKILKENGNNLVRVRLWHQPSWQQNLNGGLIFSNLADVEKTISRAKANGMAVNLNLHYSDTWTDPAKQTIPAAWQGLSLQLLADSMYNYTLQTLNYLAAKNLTPEMIQIGNETNSGMLWPLGNTISGFGPFAQLLNAGIKAVRDFSKSASLQPKIILHVAQLQHAAYWQDNLQVQGVTDYDVLGVSHYYKWSTVNDFEAISQNIAQLRLKSGKAVMVVETAFPFTNANADTYNNIFWESTATAVGFPFTEQGQRSYFTALTKAIIKGGGSGIMVWEPGWITSRLNDSWGIGSSWENNSFFDFKGNLHQGIQFMTGTYDGL